MASHLTRGDRRILAGVSRDDTIRKLDSIIDLAREVCEAAEARGVARDLSALDDIDDDETAADPQRLDDIRGELRSQLGRIGRGEVTPINHEARWTADMLRQVAELRTDMEGGTNSEENTDEQHAE